MALPPRGSRFVLVLAATLVVGGAAGACDTSSPAAPQAGPVDPGADPDSAAQAADGAAPDAQEAEGPDAFAAFAACPANRPDAGGFPPDVAAVLMAKCQTCHKVPPKDRAPFSLLTYADTQAPDPVDPYTGEPIWEVMHVVIQPDAVPHMPFGNSPQLTATEMETLDGWLLACALPAPQEPSAIDAGE
jgi:hypothetical protein